MKKHQYQKTISLSLCLLVGVLFLAPNLFAQVVIQEKTISIPTYKNDLPNPMPRFYEGKSHQGVQRRVYPYPMDDNLTNNKTDVDYQIIQVENEFIELGIVPELGGRVYYAIDKTNNYNWFYRNHVVKPSLIGMTGNWISGSLAWGFPHHHGPNTVEPMDYKIEEHPDSSKTIWIANTDRRHRMSILTGYTVYPHSSIVELTILPINRTAISNSFLFWANPAVHADSSYQVIFPPSVQYVTYHAKRDMTSWPVADSWFNNYDYTGLDLSYWKNTRVPSSFFSWNPQEDYFGGYDHGKDAGTVWVGNHYVCPGMKYWADGNNDAGRKINKGLTDNDGRYIELMAGFYTDNQPDYSWLQPYETKAGKMVWFPMRELGGLKYASRKGALNLEINNAGKAMVRINTTTPYKQAKVVLTAKGQTVLEQVINISPAEPFKVDVPLLQGTGEYDLDLVLSSASGETVLTYAPAEYRTEKQPKPKVLEPLADPKDIKTVEELYMTGLRLNQFYNASVDPMPYYREALLRDPGNYSVNTQLGILSIKNYDWETAEKYLQVAVGRITSNYTRPKDGEALYYLGIALRALGKDKEAYDNFYNASWSSAWHTASYYQLAEMDCRKGDFTTALDHLDRSLSTNVNNIKALNLKAVVLRHLNNLRSAESQAQASIDTFIINHQALNELYLIDKKAGKENAASEKLNELIHLMRNEEQSYLELATDYGNCGFYTEAIDILSRMEKAGSKFPMIYYYLGYYWYKTGDQAKALNYYIAANKKPDTYCFPFREESVSVLHNAMDLNPADAHAPYYLGNLLYELQPQKAILEWEKSAALDNTFYIVHRNLGIAYQEVLHDNAKALESMKKAVNCNNKDPRLLFEMDKLNDINKVSPKEKYELLKQNSETARKRSETLLRFATRTVEYGKFQEAIDIFNNNRIAEFEGSVEMQQTYMDAFMLRGLNYLSRKKYNAALADFKKCLSYPIGLSGRIRIAQSKYLIGLTYAKMGSEQEAKQYFEDVLAVKVEDKHSALEFAYYEGMALQKLGKLNEAKQKFEMMLKGLNSNNNDNQFFAQFGDGKSEDKLLAEKHYRIGLAIEGLGDFKGAKAEFLSSLKLNPGHVWSKFHFDSF